MKDDKDSVFSREYQSFGATNEDSARYFLAFRETGQSLLSLFYPHLTLSANYWAVTGLVLASGSTHLHDAKTHVAAQLFECYESSSGGFSELPGFPAPTVLGTLSALQLMAVCGLADPAWFVRAKTVVFVETHLFHKEPLFGGDVFGNSDVRFLYAGIVSLTLLGQRLSEERVEQVLHFLEKLDNADGGFGNCEHAESHAGHTFCVLGTLYVLAAFHCVSAEQTLSSFFVGNKKEKLVRWLKLRVGAHGVNGRACKKVDSCYGWWVGASLKMLDELDRDTQVRLVGFLERCRNGDGGFATAPGSDSDVYHTFFGLAALGILDRNPVSRKVAEVDPRLALPSACVSVFQQSA